eukprot:scaffold4266_cov83-Cylindrotheca_fusiformis.AAC.6
MKSSSASFVFPCHRRRHRRRLLWMLTRPICPLLLLVVVLLLTNLSNSINFLFVDDDEGGGTSPNTKGGGKPNTKSDQRIPSNTAPFNGAVVVAGGDGQDNDNNNYFHSECLLIYVHFHKAGGSSMINFMEKEVGLAGVDILYDNQSNIFSNGPDLAIRKKSPNGLIVVSSSSSSPSMTNDNNDDPAAEHHRAGKLEFWTNLKKHGCGFVSLEYNFLTPTQFEKVISNDNGHHRHDECIQFWTLLRDPWSRFRSTYERELQMRCQREKYTDCISNNTLEEWMKPKNLAMQYPRNGKFGGTLYPNYYVRMLNGINDRVQEMVLTEFHLEQAKSVLRRFDLVVLLENQNETTTRTRINRYFNLTANNALPKKSNNNLKKWSIYQNIVESANKQRDLFERQNTWDRKLYDFIKDELV